MSEQEQAILEAAELLEREADLIDDWEEDRIEVVKAKAKLLREMAAQVAALTEQRDALRAALKEFRDCDEGVDSESSGLGSWLSAAIDDPKCCETFKRDCERYLSVAANGRAALALTEEGK